MENLDKYTPTELLKLSNDIKSEHEKLKKEIIDDSFRLEDLEKKISKNLEELENIEKKYVSIIEEIDKR